MPRPDLVVGEVLGSEDVAELSPVLLLSCGSFFPLIKCFPCLPSAGTLTVEQIYQDRDQFAKLVREVAAPDVGRMGIEILSFTIKVRPGEGHAAGRAVGDCRAVGDNLQPSGAFHDSSRPASPKQGWWRSSVIAEQADTALSDLALTNGGRELQQEGSEMEQLV